MRLAALAALASSVSAVLLSPSPNALFSTVMLTPHQNGDTTSIGEQLRRGDCVLEVPSAASKAECNLLMDIGSSMAAQAEQQRSRRGLDTKGLVRLPTAAAGLRMDAPPQLMLAGPADDVCSALFQRVIHFIDENLPSVVDDLFGSDCTITALHEAGELEFACREPAVNIYTEGGEFLAHEDHQAITVLISLAEPESFGGGGTGFWAAGARGHRVEGPSMTLRPAAGTALLFGGHVTHAGMPVETGVRGVFVASFSRVATASTVLST